MIAIQEGSEQNQMGKICPKCNGTGKEGRLDFVIIKPEERNQFSVYFNSLISSQISINFFKLLALIFSKLYL